MNPSVAVSRGRLLAVLLALAVTGSEPLGALIPYAAYGALVVIASLAWGAPLAGVARRLLHLSPALVLLALGLPLSRMADRWLDGESFAASLSAATQDVAPGVSLLLRTLCAAGLLMTLTECLGWQGVLRGLRGLGLPLAVTAVLEHLERYRGLVVEEWRRTCHARDSRSPGGQRFALASYAGQTGMVFLRSWDRSERIHQAMVSRGYSLSREVAANGDPTTGGMVEWLRPLWLPVLALAIRIAL